MSNYFYGNFTLTVASDLNVFHFISLYISGDLIAFYCQDDLMIPFDVDENVTENTLFMMSRTKPELHQTLSNTQEWGKAGTKQFSLNAYIVAGRHLADLDQCLQSDRHLAGLDQCLQYDR